MAAKKPNRTSVWYHALKGGRGYVTPEDVRAAIFSGATPFCLCKEVLYAIEANKVEDHRLCAFIVTEGSAWQQARAARRQKKRRRTTSASTAKGEL